MTQYKIKRVHMSVYNGTT